MKYKFEQLINRSYTALINRGCITNETRVRHFIDKIKEEDQEFMEAHIVSTHETLSEHEREELTDSITARIMLLQFCGFNFIDEFEKCIVKNEKRALQHKPK